MLSLSFKAACQLQRWHQGLPPEGPIAAEPQLRACGLDYTLDSLARIDRLLERIHAVAKPSPQAFANHPSGRNLLFLLAFYSGELVARGFARVPEWLGRQQALALGVAAERLPSGAGCTVVCRLGDDGPLLTPLVPLLARLLEGAERPGLHDWAAAALAAAPKPVAGDEPLPALPPAGIPVAVAELLAGIDDDARAALRMAIPPNARVAALDAQQDALLERGRVVWAALCGLRPDEGSGVVRLLFDPAGRSGRDDLLELARRLEAMPQSVGNDAELQALARRLQGDAEPLLGLALPPSFVPYPLLLSETWLEARLLPGGRLAGEALPVLVGDAPQGWIRPLPGGLWPLDLRAEWNGNAAAQSGGPPPERPVRVEAAAVEPPPDLAALYAKGKRYFTGDGVAEDRGRALALWTRAAEAGHGGACVSLGKMYAGGHGVEADPHKAMSWFRRGAERGVARAQRALGEIHLQVDGVAPDLIEAQHWLERAAEQGDAKARALLLECGFEGADEADPAGGWIGWLRDRLGR